jgi:hypothetical protein
MTNTEKKKGKPKWVARTIVANLTTEDSRMLDALVEEARKRDHRNNIASTIGNAIKALHLSVFTTK